ncbi:hypothetical protein HO173_010885 [Letharia columbiana]|uniref:Peptidase A1 domain-containing protein n=1 Tax=Letharia columbiana TaxID=112416 RepID=A0A8H6FLY7_9LECA|nr:uncharacterized protein HO173_010885 [Letharia columbiana]KAF6230977.1 hypothetical protein HO173_010885 [Letharia columbiana]
MHHLTSSTLLCFTVLLASISAAPSKAHGNSYKVHRQAIGSGPKDGVMVLEKAYRRRNWTPPEGLTAAVAFHADVVANPVHSTIKEDVAVGGGGTGAGTVTAKVYGSNTEYLCPVQIGGQTFNMDLDTGSADFWVLNTALPAADQTRHDAIYSPSDSKSFNSIPGAWFDVAYGDNSSTSGIVGNDTVRIGTITVVGQAVELPSTVSSQFSGDINSDGIVGLGFSQFGSSIRPSPMPTFFENAASKLKEKVFTANLKAGIPGQYEFGTIDASAYQPPLTYTAVNSSGGLWQFDLSQYAVADDLYGGVASPAIADTGSSLLMLDPAIVNNYYAKVPTSTDDQQGKIFPCDTALPDFSFGIGKSMATISGSLLNYTSVPGTSDCYGGIQSNLGHGLNVLGDIMFASQFVVFDAGAMRIGFAPHA